MTDTQTLAPARQLAETNKARFPNESPEYRAARNALLVEEIELRRHIERVASSGGRFLQAADSLRISSLSPRKAPFACRRCSATKIR